MANNSTANVSVGKGVAGGYFYTAPVGTALPTDYTTALNSAFVNAGFITDEGIVSSTDAEESEFKDLNGDIILTELASKKHTIKLSFAEMNEQSLKEVLGQENVTVASGKITAKHNNKTMPYRSIVEELVLRDGRKMRRVIYSAKVSSWDDQTVAASELMQLGVTYTMTPDDNGDYYIDYIQAPAAPANNG